MGDGLFGVKGAHPGGVWLGVDGMVVDFDVGNFKINHDEKENANDNPGPNDHARHVIDDVDGLNHVIVPNNEVNGGIRRVGIGDDKVEENGKGGETQDAKKSMLGAHEMRTETLKCV